MKEGECILCIDDHETLLGGLLYLLQSNDHLVVGAANLVEARRHFEMAGAIVCDGLHGGWKEVYEEVQGRPVAFLLLSGDQKCIGEARVKNIAFIDKYDGVAGDLIVAWAARL